MISDSKKEKSILTSLIEKALKIYINKECTEITNLDVNIYSSTIQIITGFIKKINIKAKKVNYKNILLDEIELEAKGVKINYKIRNKQIKFKDNIKIVFSISLSNKSLKQILFSDNWNWIGKKISEEILNLNKLKDITIINEQIKIECVDENNESRDTDKLYIKEKNGKIYLVNESLNKFLLIPIEDKIYISKVQIKNDLLVLNANSSVSL